MGNLKIEIKKLLVRGNELRRFFLDLIFPIECLGCGDEGAWLCVYCLRKIKIAELQHCLGCGKPDEFGRFCPACRKNFSLKGFWSAASYDQALVARLVKVLKYNFATGLAPVLAKIISTFFKRMMDRQRLAGSLSFFADFSEIIVIPVPLHPRRLRWRGFNQAELIARAIASDYDLAVDCESLLRIRNNQPQTTVAPAERAANINNCFSLNGDVGRIKGKRILLVDDVATSGSTMDECARVLLAGGAREVWGFALARG